MLSIPYKKEGAALRRELGLDGSPEELDEAAFLAQIRLMSQDPAYAEAINGLWDAYYRAKEEGARQDMATIMAEATELYDMFSRQHEDPAVLAKLAEPMEVKNIHEHVPGTGAFSKFGYKIGLGDVEKIKALKAAVNDTADRTKDILSNKSDEKHGMFTDIIGENASEDDIMKFAISYVLDQERGDWKGVKSMLKGLGNMMGQKNRHPRNFGSGLDTCADIAIMGQILADEMGYEAEIVEGTSPVWPSIRRLVSAAMSGKFRAQLRQESGHVKTYHNYLRFPDGTVIDPLALPHRCGYLPPSADYDIERQRAVAWISAQSSSQVA